MQKLQASSTPSQEVSQIENSDPWTKVHTSQLNHNKNLPRNWYEKHFSLMEIEAGSFLEKLVKTLSSRDLVDPVGIWLVGGTGAGKTHILLSLFNHISGLYYTRFNGLNGNVKFWSYGDLVATIQQDPNNFDLLHKIRSAEFLFIDDIGATKGSEFIQGKIYSIFNYRLEQDLPTFVTTNLSSEDIKKEFGERMLSRIKESSAWIELKEFKDRRTNIFKNNMSKYRHLTEVK